MLLTLARYIVASFSTPLNSNTISGLARAGDCNLHDNNKYEQVLTRTIVRMFRTTLQQDPVCSSSALVTRSTPLTKHIGRTWYGIHIAMTTWNKTNDNQILRFDPTHTRWRQDHNVVLMAKRRFSLLRIPHRSRQPSMQADQCEKSVCASEKRHALKEWNLEPPTARSKHN